MNRILFVVLTSFFILLLLSCRGNKPKVFYIDVVDGNDSNSGLSPERAWQSSANIKKDRIHAGDSILFKGGQVFPGEIRLNAINGSVAKPLTISSYGTEWATVDGGDSTGMSVLNCEYLNIRNFIIKGNGRLNGNNGNGLELIKCSHCKIDNINASGFMWSGIRIIGGNNLEITGANAHDNGFCGIYAESGESEYGTDASRFKTLKNLRIAYSKAENNPGCPLIKDNHSGNGILMAGVKNGIIEYCEASNNGWDMPREGNGPVGIWAFMSDSIIIQYCYSHHNKTSKKGKDGGGFDLDGGIKNSILQYNLSAYNEGAGFGIFQYAGATEWSNNVMRYNISFNDGIKNGNSGILMWCDPIALPMKNFSAYNNTIVSNQKYGINFDPGSYADFNFTNNIFLLTAPSKQFVGGNFKKAGFENNNYWSEYSKKNGLPQPEIIYDKSPVAGDPGLRLSNSENEMLPEIGKFSSLYFFQLADSSPCMGRGININDCGKYDFWGRAISPKDKFNIGADGHQNKE